MTTWSKEAMTWMLASYHEMNIRNEYGEASDEYKEAKRETQKAWDKYQEKRRQEEA